MMTEGTPTDRTKSIHIRCEIEVFVGYFLLFLLSFSDGLAVLSFSNVFTLVNQFEFENNMQSMLIITNLFETGNIIILCSVSLRAWYSSRQRAYYIASVAWEVATGNVMTENAIKYFGLVRQF